MRAGAEAVREALAFVRSCVRATPLSPHADRFDPEACGAGDPLPNCLGEALESFRSDLDRWSLRFGSPAELFEALTLAPNLQATFFYRASRALFLAGVERVPDVIATVARQLTAIELYYSAEIGPGIKIIHGTGTVIGAQCRVGSAFTVYQNVTIGDKLGRETGGRPVIGDRVIVSSGAQVLGPVRVGNECVVGANAVVLDSLPDRCVAAGVPARIVVENLSDARFGEFWSSIKG